MSDEPANPLQDYLIRLGGFVTVFAGIEALLHEALRHYTKMPFRTANAILSGIRVDAAMSFIKRISDAEHFPKEIKDEMKYVFDQLALINQMRNDILHYGLAFGAGDFIVTNAMFAHTEDHIRNLNISPQTLSEMTSDLIKIRSHMTMWIHGDVIRLAIKDSGNSYPYDEHISSPWRYKPPPQVVRHRTNRGQPQGPSVRPEPSQA
jgi:hypothetical protein